VELLAGSNEGTNRENDETGIFQNAHLGLRPAATEPLVGIEEKTVKMRL
jgi:hypothetical protein